MTTRQFETCKVDERSYSNDDFDSKWYIGKIIDKNLDAENCYIHKISFLDNCMIIFQ